VGDEDYGSAVTGIEYPINDLIGSQDFSLSVEYAFETKDQENNRTYINRIYTNSLLTRLTHTYDYQISGELNYIYNFDKDDYFVRLLYSHQRNDFVKTNLGVDIYGGPDNSFYGAYKTNDRVFAGVELSF
jgi:hypothetical protein